ncbi:replication protein [Cronobacter sp. EKM101R]|nr:replication protein [Cronobacter sp. EKM101R]KAF6592043.1 replication protein [Cronobacter sp. EKM102R]
MTEKELEALAGQLLAKWEKHFRDGHEIPEVRKQLEKPRRPTGPTPAELLMAKYRQQQAAKNSDKH